MLSKTQRGWIRKHIKSGIIVGVVLTGGLLVVAIRADNWAEWTGLGKGESTSISIVLKQDAEGRPTQTKTTATEPGKTLWDWLSLLGIPLTLAILGYILQQQERNRAEALLKEQRERDERIAKEQREIAANEAKEETLQIYFDRLSTLLIDKNILAIAVKVHPYSARQEDDQLKTTITPEEQELFDSAIDVIRARTLSILRRFEDDAKRKSSVISFLLETEIIGKAKLNLSGANLSRTDLSGAFLYEVNLSGANLEEANLSEALLDEANFSSANLSRANLSRANLSRADLRWANFSEANLSEAKLGETHLSWANLSRANLSEANLNEALLDRANLSEANLSNIKLNRATLSETNLTGADLSGADLTGAFLLDIEWGRHTQWPDPAEVAKAKNIPQFLKQQLGIP